MNGDLTYRMVVRPANHFSAAHSPTALRAVLSSFGVTYLRDLPAGRWQEFLNTLAAEDERMTPPVVPEPSVVPGPPMCIHHTPLGTECRSCKVEIEARETAYKNGWRVAILFAADLLEQRCRSRHDGELHPVSAADVGAIRGHAQSSPLAAISPLAKGEPPSLPAEHVEPGPMKIIAGPKARSFNPVAYAVVDGPRGSVILGVGRGDVDAWADAFKNYIAGSAYLPTFAQLDAAAATWRQAVLFMEDK